MSPVEYLSPVDDVHALYDEIAFKRDAILATVTPDHFGIKVYPFLADREYLDRWKESKPENVRLFQKYPENALLHGKIVAGSLDGADDFVGLQLTLWDKDEHGRSGIVISFLEFEDAPPVAVVDQRQITDPEKFVLPDFTGSIQDFDYDMLRASQLIIDSAYKNFVYPVLYEKAGGKCEYPEGCDVTRHSELTIDHFTPLCIRRLTGASTEDTYGTENLQLLCETHHVEKDSSTRSRKGKMRAFLNGERINLSKRTRKKINALVRRASAYDSDGEQQEQQAV